MKLVEHFNAFMTDVVNLNQTRVGQLEDSVEALKGVIRSSTWKPRVKSFVEQGSWAHKTIIRPVEGGEFDADLLVLAEPVEGWSAKEYLSTLRAVFADNTTYKDKVRRHSHCVTIEYAGERKVDIAPCIVNRGNYNRLEVCNFNVDAFELSEPEQYTAWLIERNGWTGNNGLRKVTRLLKYLRDIKTTFSCPSVLFTTLLGDRISAFDEFDSVNFVDLPTALKTIVGRLDAWLQRNPARPTVTNPKLPSEILSDLWTDDTQYENFRNKINTYRSWIDDAYDEADRDESIGKWQRVFGDDFARGIVEEKAGTVSVAELSESTALTRPGFYEDLVARFVRLGRGALPANFDRLPHKKRPTWRRATTSPFQVEIVASQHTRRTNGVWVTSPQSGAGPLPKQDWLKFDARTGVGMPIPADFETHWRVTNTDQEAKQARQLRGGFEKPNDGTSRWEQLQYRGVHTVEAFVVRKRDGLLVAQSDPFYVVIE